MLRATGSHADERQSVMQTGRTGWGGGDVAAKSTPSRPHPALRARVGGILQTRRGLTDWHWAKGRAFEVNEMAVDRLCRHRISLPGFHRRYLGGH